MSKNSASEQVAPLIQGFTDTLSSHPLESLLSFLIIFAGWPLYLQMVHLSVVMASLVAGLFLSEGLLFSSNGTSAISRIVFIIGGTLLGLILFQKYKKLSIFVMTLTISILLFTGYTLNPDGSYLSLDFGIFSHLKAHADWKDIGLSFSAAILATIFERFFMIALSSAVGSWIFYNLSGNKYHFFALFFLGAIVQYILSAIFKREISPPKG